MTTYTELNAFSYPFSAYLYIFYHVQTRILNRLMTWYRPLKLLAYRPRITVVVVAVSLVNILMCNK